MIVLLCLPGLAALLEALAFHERNANNGSIVSSGRVREYLLHVPKSYDAGRPTSLVISLHGAGGWPAQQRDISRWNELADERGFIVVYPSGVGGRASRVWRMTNLASLAEDVRFVADLIDELHFNFNIDPARIYANGLSAGGGMSFALSCTLAERIAAVGTVAAARVLAWDWCPDDRPVALMAFHGTDDSVVPYEGGETWIGDITFPDVEGWIGRWARRNGCDTTPAVSTVAPDVTRQDYRDCAQGGEVVLFTIHGGGHTWPGGKPLPEWFLGPTNQRVDATREMWTFFEAHPLPVRRAGRRPAGSERDEARLGPQP